MRRLLAVATGGAAALVAGLLPLTTSTAASAADPIACQRPAPDNRVSTTIHCYTPEPDPRVLRARPADRRHHGRRRPDDRAGRLLRQPDRRRGRRVLRPDLRRARRPTSRRSSRSASPATRTPTGNGQRHVRADGGRRLGRRGEPRRPVGLRHRAEGAHRAARHAPAETQGVQGLPNLMKAIDWADRDVPGRHGVLDVVRYQRGGVRRLVGAATQFAKFDQTFQRGLAKHDTFFASSGDDGSLGVEPGAPPDRDGRPPVGQLPEHLPLRHLGRRHPGAVRLDLEPDVRTSRSTPTAAATRPTGRGPRRQQRGRLERDLGTDRHRRRPVHRLRATRHTRQRRRRRRQPPRRARPGLERCGQRRRAGVAHLLPGDLPAARVGRLRRYVGRRRRRWRR